jgi:hypothetical protein
VSARAVSEAVRLPALIGAYVDRCVPAHIPPLTVTLRQEGVMWKEPRARSRPFTATEELAVTGVAFAWRARFPIFGPLAMHVTDGFADGAGHMLVRLLGYPIVRSTGPEIAVGGALRYLAELPWAPLAMAYNDELEWRELDEHAVEVSTVVHDQRLAVRFDLDAGGDIVRASAASRPYARAGGFDLVPWGGEYREYAVLGGMRMPTVAAVYWDLPDGRFTYWRGTVTSAAGAARDS